MAQGTTVQYVQFYTSGSAARKFEPTVQLQPLARPKPKKQKKIIVRIDPVAMLGIAVAAVMLILMICGINRLCATQNETAIMNSYVQQLRTEKQELQAKYTAGYDIGEVEQMALALGMVQVDQVQQVGVHLSVPQQPQAQKASLWDGITTFLAGIFA